jgi:hypothetical protein
MPMKIAYTARYTHHPSVIPNRFRDSTYAPMKVAIAAGAIEYSMRIAVPVANPPQGPMARLANVYPPPAAGSADDISAMPSTIARYIPAMTTAAMRRPPKPPSARPLFQPA